jgi:hypothetical protein
MTQTSKPRLADTLREWPRGSWKSALKGEIEALPSGSLPLETAVTRCGIVDDNDVSVTVINANQNSASIQVKVGVFFTEIVAGCVCGEDPIAENGYCELLVHIDKITGAADFELIQS